jgi:hypothetical protein
LLPFAEDLDLAELPGERQFGWWTRALDVMKLAPRRFPVGLPSPNRE